MTVCAAGNSSVPLMKQAGYSHASPGAPSFGNGRHEDQGGEVDEDHARR